MINKILVTIIIPNFNDAHVFEKALDSVIMQSYTEWECIVVDDGSSDSSIEVLQYYQKKDNRIKIFQRDRQPKGASTCRNIGLSHSKGDYIIFLDSDDYLLPFCLEQRVEAIREYLGFHFLVFPMGIVKENTVLKKEIPEYNDYLIPFLSANLPWQTMCPIWDREFLNQLKGFSEGYPRFNDPEIMIRALVQKNVCYKVFNSIGHDSVHYPTDDQSKVFHDKVYKSLRLLIADITKLLKDNGLDEYKKYLALYLHFWFKYVFTPLNSHEITPSVYLIYLFKKYNVISFKSTISLYIRFVMFFCSNLFLKEPINKLISKGVYLK